jgi:xanthine/CO dehydrogenase XdhC/CoxF family maturation factor
MEPYARGDAALRARRGRRPPTRGGVRTRHPAHPGHPRAVEPRPRQGTPGSGRQASARLERRHAARRLPHASSTTSGACAAWPGTRSWSSSVRRVGPRRPALLAEQMQRLHRVTFRTIWVNPLKVTPGYAPLARGMAAALPFVDAFVEGPLDRGDGGIGGDDLAGVIAGAPLRRTSQVTPSTAGATMRELLDDIDRWRATGKRVAIARVVDIEGSGPRLPGAAMAVNEAGEVAGSVSGGCVEGAVVAEALGDAARRCRGPEWSPSATATTRRSPSASRAAARSACSSKRSTGERRDPMYQRAQRAASARAACRSRHRDRRARPGTQAAGRPGERHSARSAAPSSTASPPATRSASSRRAVAASATTAPTARPPLRIWSTHAGRRGRVRRELGAAAADVDLRRRRLHRGPGARSPRCSATGCWCAMRARSSPLAGASRWPTRSWSWPGPVFAERGHTLGPARRGVHPHPRPEVRRARGAGSARHHGRLHRRDGQPHDARQAVRAAAPTWASPTQSSPG